MKNKFFSNKFLPILSVFLLVTFVFTTTVFGFSSKCPVCDEQLELNYPDGVSSIILTDDGSGRHVNNMILVKLDGYYYIILTSSNNGHSTEKLYIDNGTFCTSPSCYLFAYFKYVNNSWNYIGHNDISFSNNIINNASFLSSTSNIYTDSSLTDVFFQSAPLGITKTLVEETEKVQIAEQLRTMVVGFLKYLIALVISVIAFWKGWQFLLTQLKRS